MILENLLVPDEPGEFLVPQIEKAYTKMMGIWQRNTEPTEGVPSGQSWNNLSNKMNKVVLDYNSRYKINIYKSMLI